VRTFADFLAARLAGAPAWEGWRAARPFPA